MKNKIILILFFSVSFYNQIFSIVIGSTTAVSVEPTANFPSADTDNTMLGFGWFQNGFTLEDSVTTCTFDAVFPVSGGINLNGGTLFLNKDLLFQNITTLNGLGTIIAENHAINFCTGISSLPLDSEVFKDATLILNDDLTISNTILFQGNSLIDGNGKTIILDSNAAILVDSNSFLTFKNLYIQNMSDNKISCTDNSGAIQFDDVNCEFLGSSTFALGSILFNNGVEFIGTATFYYTSSLSSTIQSSSQWTLKNGMTLSIGRFTNNNVQPLNFTDSSSYLKFYQSNWLITSTGMQITKGTLVFDRNVEIDIQATSTTYGLIIGDGIQNEDSIFQLNSGAAVRFGSGIFTYNNFQQNLIQSSSINAQLIRGQNSNFEIFNNLTIPSVTVVLESALTPPIINNNFLIQFLNSKLKFPALELDVTCDSLARSVLFMDGDGDSLSFSKGILPVPINVSGSKNIISGNGSLAGIVTLQDSLTTLTCALNGTILNSIAMNGGNLVLLADLDLGNTVTLTGTGSVNLSAFSLNLGSQSLTWTSTLSVQGNNGKIKLNNNLSLLSTWTINGSVVIDGDNNTLDFGAHGAIVVNPNSRVTFKNIKLTDVATQHLSCINDSGIITLNNVTWIQNGHFDFPTGRLNFLNSVDMSGSYSFIYESSQTSTINQNSELNIHSGITFVMGKSSMATSVQPFSFVDQTSVMQFEDCTVSINPNGLQLTKGTIATVRSVTIDINSTSTANGLTLGDGVSADDVTFNLYPGSTITFPNGNLNLNLTSFNAIKSMSDSAVIIREADSIFYLAQSLMLSDFTIKVFAATPLIAAPGATLFFNNITYQTPVGTLKVTGEQLTSSILLLSGNGNIFAIAGVIPFALEVSNAGNIIGGTGNTLFPITLQDNNAQLIWTMAGSMLATTTMNGGMLVLGSDITLGPDVLLSGSGTVVLNNNNFNLGINPLVWSDPITFDGLSGSINLYSDLTLNTTWTITGTCTINGNNQNTLDTLNGSIIVAPGSQLVLSNIICKNINGTNIQCADDTASIILNNVIWIQNDNFIFDAGALQISNNCIFRGQNLIFAYETLQTSTILSHSSLFLDQLFSFSYYPQDNVSNNLLQFIDQTSSLQLNNANFYCGISGLNLTKGSMDVNRNCIISSDIFNDGFSITDTGITFGDDMITDDFAITILQGSQLSLIQGSINYRNIDQMSWTETDVGSNLYLGNNTTLRLYESLDIGPGTIKFDNATLAQATGAQLIGGISVIGGITYASL